MPVDPTDPDTFEADAAEENGADGELDAETPEADAAEQRAELRRHEREPPPRIHPETASEGDAVDQARSVDPGWDESDGDYR
jgi:hypothetical protein